MRRKRKFTRDILPDPKYGNVQIAKFINHVMRRGKKSTAQRAFYGAMDLIEKKHGQDPLNIFDTAIRNVGPLLEVKSRRIGGATYQVPREVRGERKFFLASNWILAAARAGKGKPIAEKLANEPLLAAKNEGNAIKKRADVNRMADANKAFAHFAF